MIRSFDHKHGYPTYVYIYIHCICNICVYIEFHTCTYLYYMYIYMFFKLLLFSAVVCFWVLGSPDVNRGLEIGARSSAAADVSAAVARVKMLRPER